MTPLVKKASSYRGRLLDPLWKNAPELACNEVLKLESEADFAAVHAMSLSDLTPPLMSFAQSYGLLERIVASARRHLSDGFEIILITARMPAGTRICPALHAADILMMSDVTNEAARLNADGVPHVVIHDRFVKHSLEAGDNTLEVSWIPYCDRDKGPFEFFTVDLGSLGFREVPETLGK